MLCRLGALGEGPVGEGLSGPVQRESAAGDGDAAAGKAGPLEAKEQKGGSQGRAIGEKQRQFALRGNGMAEVAQAARDICRPDTAAAGRSPADIRRYRRACWASSQRAGGDCMADNQRCGTKLKRVHGVIVASFRLAGNGNLAIWPHAGRKGLVRHAKQSSPCGTFWCKMQRVDTQPLTYQPAISPEAVSVALACLLDPAPLVDRDLEGRIVRLEERFRVYAATYPYGLWAPGLVITPAMRGMTELYLPLVEIRRALQRLYAASLVTPPAGVPLPLYGRTSWLDMAESLQPLVSQANPAALLRAAMADGELRRRFLFALCLPRRYGGGFGRYPRQAAYLAAWLNASRERLVGEIRCLDAACGSGEGTYELAMLLLEGGYAPSALEVHGATLEPLELFAAAHAWFPHDPSRASAYRQRIQPLLGRGAGKRMRFMLEDIAKPESDRQEGYDVILCNGLLGGPLLHDRQELARVVTVLAGRLRGGGILLAADRFHAGWKARVPANLLEVFFASAGLTVLEVAEGVAGIKDGPGIGARGLVKTSK